MTSVTPERLKLRRLGIDTYREHVIFLREDSHVCRAEGFEALTRVRVCSNGHETIATLHVVTSDVLAPGEVSLSESAWHDLEVREGDQVQVTHPEPVESLRLVRAKIYGNRMDYGQFREVLADAVKRRYTDVELAAFVTACAQSLDVREVVELTRAMVDSGDKLDWGRQIVADKHCVGGLPGNRTTPIVVAIVAAAGLTMPKTSSRAITSPAGTADTMETMAPVDLDLAAMRRVVEQEGGCVVWGGAMRLSPADDVLVRIERALDIDSAGQMVASVLSKKAAAGSTHVLIDIPVGPTAKVRSDSAVAELRHLLAATAETLDLHLRVMLTDGRQPVGRGIGPALEARDVLAVLRGDANAPDDLRERALELASAILELTAAEAGGAGYVAALRLLDSGAAWRKFQAICEAQGGFREPPGNGHSRPVMASHAGTVTNIDNRRMAMIAKLAGAPGAKAAGVEFLSPLGRRVEKGEPLYVVHAETPGELNYALAYAEANPQTIVVERDS